MTCESWIAAPIPDWGTVAREAPISQIVTSVPATATSPPSAASTARNRTRTSPRWANAPSIPPSEASRPALTATTPRERNVALVGSDDHDAMRPAMNAPSSAPPRNPA